MIPAFHVFSFANDARMELSLDEKIKLYCSATQWAAHNGPIDLICDKYFLDYILRESLQDLYMNIVPLEEGEDMVETALRTAPIGHVYLGVDVVVDGPVSVFTWSDLFKATSPNGLSREGLRPYPKKDLKDMVALLDEVPDFIYF